MAFLSNPIMGQEVEQKNDATNRTGGFVAPSYSLGKEFLYREVFGKKKFKLPKEFRKKTALDSKVLVRLLISDEGEFVDSDIVNPLGTEMEKKLEKKLDKLKGDFSPATKRGKPVEAWLTLTLRLQKGSF